MNDFWRYTRCSGKDFLEVPLSFLLPDFFNDDGVTKPPPARHFLGGVPLRGVVSANLRKRSVLVTGSPAPLILGGSFFASTARRSSIDIRSRPFVLHLERGVVIVGESMLLSKASAFKMRACTGEELALRL